jgi:hypothetical protein
MKGIREIEQAEMPALLTRKSDPQETLDSAFILT